jgi:predicted Zn-ribbon and HTH transcriptional regulator
MLILLKEDRKPIKIEPIKIVSNQEKPLDILSKLEVATKVSTERLTSSEEVSNKVLESLKETIAQQQR